MPNEDKIDNIFKIGRPSKYDPKFCDILIDVMKDGGHVAMICCTLGIVKETFYNWIKDHEEFKKAYEIAKMYNEAYYEELGRRLATGSAPKGANATAYAIIMNNKFGWSKRESSDLAAQTINIQNMNVLQALPKEELLEKIKYKLENNPELLEAINKLNGQSTKPESTGVSGASSIIGSSGETEKI